MFSQILVKGGFDVEEYLSNVDFWGLVIGLLSIAIIPKLQLFVVSFAAAGFVVFSTHNSFVGSLSFGVFFGMLILIMLLLFSSSNGQTLSKYYQEAHEDFFNRALIPLLKKIGFTPRYPAEIQISLAELDLLGRQGNFLSAYELIHPLVKEMITNEKRALITIAEYHISPRELTMLLVSNVTEDLLVSGKYHSYRGRLSMTGDELFLIYHKVNDELLKTGFRSQEQYDENLDWLKVEIKSLG